MFRDSFPSTYDDLDVLNTLPSLNAPTIFCRRAVRRSDVLAHSTAY
jgi:hypothetical protein